MISKFSIIVVSLIFLLLESVFPDKNSIFKQKYKKYEIIVIDGLSSDGSIEYIRKLKNKNICKIIERDKGIYDAMNKGIKKAKGDIIGWLNSDDTYNPEAIKTAVEFFADHPDIDLIAVRGTMSDVMDGKTGEQRMYYVFDAMLDGTCTEEF